MNEAIYPFELGTLRLKYKDEVLYSLKVERKEGKEGKGKKGKKEEGKEGKGKKGKKEEGKEENEGGGIVSDQQGRNAFTDRVVQEIEEYMRGERQVFDIRYKFPGSGEEEEEEDGEKERATEFQRKVWGVLETIPYGEVMTYSEVAGRIHRAKAVRAVGGACHKNPIWLIVPCHRVIGKSGELTGYGGGLEMKRKLLGIEKKYKERKKKKEEEKKKEEKREEEEEGKKEEEGGDESTIVSKFCDRIKEGEKVKKEEEEEEEEEEDTKEKVKKEVVEVEAKTKIKKKVKEEDEDDEAKTKGKGKIKGKGKGKGKGKVANCKRRKMK